MSSINDAILALEEIFGSFDEDQHSEVTNILDSVYDEAFEDGMDAGISSEDY
jgi:hypothetical protein